MRPPVPSTRLPDWRLTDSRPTSAQPRRRHPRRAIVTGAVAATALIAAACSGSSTEVTADTSPTTAGASTSAEVSTTDTAAPTTSESTTTTAPATTTTPPPPPNVYASMATPNPVTAGHRFLVYVPHEVSGTTMVIDPTTQQVVNTFTTGAESQHVVPSWDMTTLYAISSRGDLVTPIDPATGNAGPAIEVEDPYNLYFTPDGAEAIIVEEGNQTLTFRDAKTFAWHSAVQVPCPGLNHLDYSADFSYFIATCEFEGTMIKFDMASRQMVGKMTIDMTPSGQVPRNGHAQPQDVRLSADGAIFYVADLQSAGVYLIDGTTMTQIGYVPTGVGAHGLYPSRDGRKLYVVNRGTPIVGGPPGGQGSISVIDFATRAVEVTWPIPGGGSPDMGNLTPDGTQLWLGGRYDGEIYAVDTRTGELAARIPVGRNPHGLTVWPQPGRMSLGHTGNMR